MTQHTPEPWYISGLSPVMVISNNATIAKCAGIREGTQQQVQAELEANAARIAACVNFCAGLSTEQLESEVQGSALEMYELLRDIDAALDSVNYSGNYVSGIEKTKEENEKLKDACKKALEAMEWDVGGEPLPTLELAAMEAIRRALFGG